MWPPPVGRRHRAAALCIGGRARDRLSGSAAPSSCRHGVGVRGSQPRGMTAHGADLRRCRPRSPLSAECCLACRDPVADVPAKARVDHGRPSAVPRHARLMLVRHRFSMSFSRGCHRASSGCRRRASDLSDADDALFHPVATSGTRTRYDARTDRSGASRHAALRRRTDAPLDHQSVQRYGREAPRPGLLHR
jgi:hypothetical protein